MDKTILGLILVSALAYSGCERKSNEEVEIVGNRYNVSKNEIVQTQGTNNNHRIGVISDLEGALGTISNAARIFKNEKVDMVLVAGDLYSDFARQSSSEYNVQEGVKSLEPLVGLDVPVYVIPGNHESEKDYSNIIKHFAKNKNVFDLSDRLADLKGVNIVGLGGYHDSRFTSPHGAVISDSQYGKLEKNIEKVANQNEPTVMLTHGPPKSDTPIDYVPNVGHVGDSKLTGILNSHSGTINVHGHIHEGGGNVAKYGSNSFAINVSCASDFAPAGNRAGILSVSNGIVNYQEVKLK